MTACREFEGVLTVALWPESLCASSCTVFATAPTVTVAVLKTRLRPVSA
jgi:hypothetical protein